MSDDRSLTLTISPEGAQALREAVSAGEFATLDEALADALGAWARRHEEREEELAWIKAKVSASLHDPRPSLSLEEVDAHLDAFFSNVEASRSRSDEAA